MSGVAGLAKGITSMNRLKAAIKDMPLRLQNAVAKDAAGWLDIEVRDDFDAGRTVYDNPRPLGVQGNKLTLIGKHLPPKTTRRWKKGRRTPYPKGHVRDSLGFTVVGRIIRASLNQKHARYLVGKYKILPQSLPASWRAHLEQLVREYAEDYTQEAGR